MACTVSIITGCGSEVDDVSSASTDAAITDEATTTTSAAAAPATGSSTGSSTTVAPLADADQPDDGMVEVTDHFGTQRVPVTDRGLVTLDEQTGLTLLALGLRPESVNAFLGDTASVTVLESAGIPVTPVGQGQPSIEAVAAADPAMIISVPHPNYTPAIDQLNAIAPVVMPPYTAPWEAQMRTVAEVTGRTDDAEALIERVEAKVEATAAAVRAAGLEGATISIIADYGGTITAFGQTTLAGTLVERVGLTRPPSEGLDAPDGGFGFINVAEETLPDHDADIAVGLVGTFAPVSINENPLRSTGSDVIVASPSAEVWVANTPLAAYWILEDIERIVSGSPGDTLTIDSVLDVWEQLTE